MSHLNTSFQYIFSGTIYSSMKLAQEELQKVQVKIGSYMTKMLEKELLVGRKSIAIVTTTVFTDAYKL